jgi:hypothetical protein
VVFAAEERVDGLVEEFAFEVPQSHVHRAHGGDGDGGAAEVLGAAIHLLPEALVFEGIFADENFAEAAGDVVAVGGVNDGFDDFG